jgi:hypothetical protein
LLLSLTVLQTTGRPRSVFQERIGLHEPYSLEELSIPLVLPGAETAPKQKKKTLSQLRLRAWKIKEGQIA